MSPVLLRRIGLVLAGTSVIAFTIPLVAPVNGDAIAATFCYPFIGPVQRFSPLLSDTLLRRVRVHEDAHATQCRRDGAMVHFFGRLTTHRRLLSEAEGFCAELRLGLEQGGQARLLFAGAVDELREMPWFHRVPLSSLSSALIKQCPGIADKAAEGEAVWQASLRSRRGDSAGRIAPVVRFVPRGNGARVEVLDWGGKGPALVFLPGLGNTAHVYQEFAGRFADRYRTVGITPRGFGASTPTDRGVPLDTLMADIAAVLDSFALAPATIVGHSLGGDLATFFAARYPSRVARVIYLEGANDRRPGHQPKPTAPWPPPPDATVEDSSSDIAYQGYIERTFGPRIPLPDLHATYRFDTRGKLSGSVTAGSVTAVLLASMGPAPFDSVRAPALAIFSKPDSARYDMPYWNRLSGSARADANSLQAWFVSSTRANIDAIAHLLRHVTVVEIPRSGHLVFLMNPAETETAMRRFLGPVDSTLFEHDAAATQARNAGDWASYRYHVRAIDSLLVGGSPRVTVALARAEAKLGHPAEAMALLSAFAATGLTRAIDTDSDFVSALASDGGWQPLLEHLRRNREPRGSGGVAYVLPDSDFVAEDLSWDSASARVFVSSIRQAKVVSIDAKGVVADFIPAGRDGLRGILAVGVDRPHGLLWITTSGWPVTKGYQPVDSGFAELRSYDLATGALRRRYQLPPVTRKREPGDIVVSRTGDVYIGDGAIGAVYVYRRSADTVETLIPPGQIVSPQQPALSADERTLYVADYSRGIAMVNLATRTVRYLAHERGTAANAIDGLVYYRGDLIGVQNGVDPVRVVRFRIDPVRGRIRSWSVLAQRIPWLDEPTHLAVVGNSLLVVGNSGFGAYDPLGARLSGKALAAPRILRIPLAPGGP